LTTRCRACPAAQRQIRRRLQQDDGAPVWKVLDDPQAYVSPMLVELAGRRQIVVVSSYRVVGSRLRMARAVELSVGYGQWHQRLAADRGRSKSFLHFVRLWKGAALVEVKGSGNSFTASTIWENKNMKNKFNSSVLHNGYVYGLDEGILVCLDVNTGERKWKDGRYGYGQIILAGTT
jgi:outer membrane protein assembly factor BamB